MKLNLQRLAIPGMPDGVYEMLAKALISYPEPSAETTRLTLNLFDSDYDMDSGGFHPVEISLIRQGEEWQISYITDFAYHSQPFPELIKDIDVDIEQGCVEHVFTGRQSLAAGAELTQLFISNLIAYYDMGVYQQKLTIDDLS
ncbi:DUF2787 domain-containing protein [Parashewanella spongiae]|uniref:DUF2787 domain-containing protein n=1 Tax=Parashewanella spongiae TaxID=342950 RepID=A0A3A6UM21_9GAMM|nr:DUF2787 family protein [Parashewanella spongiae]MCL1077049.1 DUF2787 domain-containing protein [Parashewanella spongiae]RJY18737.1 DUF2787 domain-containing protein [Parashewanella spongiae]